ncbi:hypothetical protein LTR17_009877 [Elasticomyces elasticus]|nr:hypothetical protein LTR17_009877 [Elasticomyces elasticus]
MSALLRPHRQPPRDLEKGPQIAVPEYLPGFGEAAAFVSTEREGGSFRRFQKLSALNILYMQSELSTLEESLHELDRLDREDLDTLKDVHGHDAVQQQQKIMMRATNWESLLKQEKEGEDRAKRWFELSKQLKKAIKRYQEAVIRDHKVASMPTPSEGYMQAFRFFLESRLAAIHVSGTPLFEIERGEYVVTHQAPETDRLTKYIQNVFGLPGFSILQDKRNVPPSWAGFRYYSDSKIERIVSVLSVLLAVTLLVGAIVSLGCVTTKGPRLAILAAFTVTFAAAVGLLTSARRVEVYGASAAFAAVLVVYVGSSNGT